MHPKFTSHKREATFWTTGKSMMLPEWCSMEQIGIVLGRGVGARFIKKKLPEMPFGYRFITIARFWRCGRSHGETSK
jgi:hypothetical protein